MQNEWNAVCQRLQQGLSKGQYDFYVATLSFVRFDGHCLTLGCRSKFHAEWLRTHLARRILEAAQERFPQLKECRFEILSQVPHDELKEEEEEIRERSGGQLTFLDIGQPVRTVFNPRFTFDQFVVGHSNHFAYATCMAVAAQRGFHHQSVYLMADPGLGKSHLTHAVGNLLTREAPNMRVRYVTAEQFTNEMVAALRRDRIEDFKKTYRDGCDILLLEKVEFFSGKRKIQDELIYTLDELLDRGRRIICTGKTSPKDIPKLNHELRSRLGGLLVAPIDRPDFKTRKEIVRRKAAYDNVHLPAEVVEFLADRVTTDVRQLESCLVGLMAKSSILGIPISLSLAQEVTQTILEYLPTLDIAHVTSAVCRSFGLQEQDLRSKARSRRIAEARRLAMYLCRKYTKESLNGIARAFNRSHSTVIYAIKKVDQELGRKNSSLKKLLEHVSRRIETRCLDE